tara:strand:- start:275 stop:709 length:435 start_codon:yes stop_codon:yes gene_type:complete
MSGVIVKPYNLFFCEFFKIRHIKDCGGSDYHLDAYNKNAGYSMAENLSKKGQIEPLIIVSQEFDINKKSESGYFRVEPGQTRLAAMLFLKWEHCKSVLIMKEFMSDFLIELKINYEEITLKNALKECKLNSPSYNRILDFFKKG